MNDLYEKILRYLQKTHASKWVTKAQILEASTRAGHTLSEAYEALKRLERSPNVGVLWSKELRAVTYRWYPWQSPRDDQMEGLLVNEKSW